MWVARVTALSGVNIEDNLRVPPRSQDGLEGYSDKLGGMTYWTGLVSTLRTF